MAPVDPENPEGETSAAEEWRRFGQTAGFLLGGGFQMVAAAACGFFAGRWIDRQVGTEPILTVVLAALGLVGGVWLLWRSIQTLQRRQAQGSGEFPGGGRRKPEGRPRPDRP